MMKRPLLALCALACLLPAAARAQGPNSLEGRVLLPSGGQPAQPVRVTLTQGGRRIHETFTDLSGRFNFPGLRGGAYRLTAEGDGRAFETTSVGVEIASFGGGGQNLTQNIQLKARADAAGAPAASVAAEELDPGVPDAAKEKYRRGARSAAEGKPEQAVRALREAVKAHP